MLLLIGLEILIPFLFAGLGMVGAGLLLDHVKHWEVYQNLPELFILVPALLGLKGNLEMTLASRLSTAANNGLMNNMSHTLDMAKANLALIQFQGIVVGTLAASFAIAISWILGNRLNLSDALLLITSGLITASLASFVLGIAMVVVVLLSVKYRVNPDNVATPLAASLGDLTTLGVLSWTAYILHKLPASRVLDAFVPAFMSNDCSYFCLCVIIFYATLVTPTCYSIARSSAHTRSILRHGWTPVFVSMIISSLGGAILNHTLNRYPEAAAFQPVISGVAGNLASVQASRISTRLHCERKQSSPDCGADKYSNRTIGFLLLSFVVPGHLVFNYAISLLHSENDSVDWYFLALYLTAAFVQVALLLYVTEKLVRCLWTRGIDPDNAAIPYLTASGDLLGGALLSVAMHLASILRS